MGGCELLAESSFLVEPRLAEIREIVAARSSSLPFCK